MAVALPTFPAFNLLEEHTAATRWRKWIDRFENMLTALSIDDDSKMKAMLLHYIGEDVYDIFDSFTDGEKGIGATRVVGYGADAHVVPNEYGIAKRSLTNYFTPKRNTAYEVFKFRQASQQTGESIDTFYTRLRTLAATCDFHDFEREILAQIVQGCSSSRVRRKALKDNLTLQQVLDDARAQELSESRAAAIENTNVVHAVSGQTNTQSGAVANTVRQKYNMKGRGSPARGRGFQPRGRGSYHGNQYYQSNRGRGASQQQHGTSQQQHSASQEHSGCRYCGSSRLHAKSRCPARGKRCRRCEKLNHFESVCEQTDAAVRHIREGSFTQDRDVSSSDESVFSVHVNAITSKTPAIVATVGNSEINFLIDTGASVNILSGSDYEKMNRKPNLKSPSPQIYAYGSQDPLPVRGFFKASIGYKETWTQSSFYVVDTDGRAKSHSLLSADTAQALNVVQFAFASSAMRSRDTHTGIPGQFPALFDGSLGKVQDVKVQLHIDNTVQPVAQRHRRIPFHVRKDVEVELERLEKLDVIEKVEGATPWISPVVVVPKKNGGVRVCIDMREANRAIGREKHPMPTIDDLIADLNSSTVFSKLDMTNAYHQLELDEASRYITTFSTHVGLRRYKRLLFGVNAASEIFQKAIADLLDDIPGAQNITDDIIVHGKSQREHDESLRRTLKRLQDKGVRLNREKCKFSVDKLTFFGHVLSEKGISVDPDKVETIVGKSAPKSVGEVRSFLGMTQYVARFIPRYATLTEPLRRLTRQDVTWQWTDHEQCAFDALKQALAGADVMAYFDPRKHTEIFVDASPVGLGAIFTQSNKIVSYASRALTDVEQRYSQTDREMLAVVYGVEHFHLYLYGAPFTVFTDHKPLLGIMRSQKPTTARIERWRLRLMPYDFQLMYRPGKNELNPADYISRHPHTQPEKDNAGEEYIRYVTRNAVPKAMSLEEVRQETAKDLGLQKLMQAIQNGKWNDDDLSCYSQFRDELSVTDGVVLRDHRLIIPPSLQKRVVDIAHFTHQGIVKTKQFIREKVWFPGIDNMVAETVKSCIPCQASNLGQTRREPLCPTSLPSGPWVEVAIDFAGPFPTGEYALVVIDEYSRFPEVEIVSSTSAKVVIPRLDSIFARHGIPETVKTDNGPPFSGQEFRDFAETSGFYHRKITPLWPEANGEAERFMGTLNKYVRACAAENQNWKTRLPHFLRQYRATPHSATNVSPFEALTGRKMPVGLPSVPKRVPVSVPSRMVHNDAVSKMKSKKYVDKKRRTQPSSIAPGDSVLVRQRKLNKLTPPYNPLPYTVVQKHGSMVTAENGHHRITRNSTHFKPVQVEISPYLEEEEEERADFHVPLDGESVREPASTRLNTHTPLKNPVVPTDSPSAQAQASRTPIPSPVAPRRSQRSVGLPQRFSDFVMT